MTRKMTELKPAQRGGLVALGVLEVALLIAALVDIRRRPADEINGSKRIWRYAAFINFIGPVAYFTFGRRTKS